VNVHPRALKHGVLPEGAIQAVDHAMPARKQYWDLLP